MACQLLEPRSGEKVLDACAAPGGKTGYLAELMNDRGVIVACDRQSKRVRGLEENLARIGVEIAHVFRHNWVDSWIPSEIASLGPFDRVLIDAPCSNTGVMRRRVDVRWRLRPANFARMQKRQIEIVRAVVPLLKPAGTLVYSTCSLEPEENDEVLEHLLATLSMLHLEEKKESFPFRDNLDGAFAAKFIRSVR
jgi:16S rRNA (cytosine967-C5)-methyltransferase